MSEKNDAVYDFTTSNIKLPDWWGDTDKEFGYFSDDGREYIITTPETPRPWLNYIGNDDYGLVLGNHGEGFSWYKAMTARVTRYTSSEYVPREPDGRRYAALKFEDDENFIHIASSPRKDSYKCVHGLGYSVIHTQRKDVKASWRVFVPLDDPVEIWQVRLENTCSRRRRFSLAAALQWQLGQYTYCPPCSYQPLSDIDKDIRVEFDAERNTFTAENTSVQPLNFKGFFASSVKSKRTGELSDDNNCSAFEIDIELEAGQSREVLFVAGIFFDKQELETLSCKYTKQKADEAFDAMKRYWDDVINKNVNIKTGCKEIDLWCNIRLKSLLYNTKRWTRGLDRGYRDILQDLRGFLMIDPGEVKNKLLEALSFQYGDGRALRQYSAVGTEHDRRDYSDSPIWIADVLTSYIKESGDMEILQKQVPFFDGGSGSVYEHNLRAIKYLLDDRGAHGLCRLRYGDWNDALEGIGKKGFAEGVWLSMALYWSMKLTRELAAFIGDFQTSGYLANSMRQVKDAVNEFGWQGRWYAYALDDEGEAIGSPDNQEGKLHLNPQSFAVFTGIADDERAGLCMEAVDQYLETDFGPLLVWPCYKNEKIGRIWRMEPGTFENGSMYFHGAAFKMLAEAAAGRSDAAVDTFLKVLPSNPQNPPARSTIEPYALGNYYCGRDNQLAGLNIYSHFTGSYSWMLKCIIEYVIGVKADYNGLRIEPALPQDWDEVEIFRRFRGRQYQICIKRSADVPGSYDIYVNGKRHNIDGLPVIIY